MPFLCCGNNSAVIEDTSKPPVPVEAPTESSASKPPSPEVIVPEQRTKPEVERKQEPPQVVEPVSDTKASSAAAVDTTTVKEEEPPKQDNNNDFLKSIIGSNVMLNGETYKTKDAFQNSALVAIYYASADNEDVTKKLEIFCAGYESKTTLDVIYCCPTDSSPATIPSTWYTLSSDNADSSRVVKNVKQIVSIKMKAPCWIVTNPGSEQVVSTQTVASSKKSTGGAGKASSALSSLDQILALDPLSVDDYDTKATQIFQQWIQAFPQMEQNVVSEIELTVEEPEDDDDDESDESDSDEDWKLS